MSLIQRVGGQGMAEIIVSLQMTRAILPNCCVVCIGAAKKKYYAARKQK